MPGCGLGGGGNGTIVGGAVGCLVGGAGCVGEGVTGRGVLVMVIDGVTVRVGSVVGVALGVRGSGGGP